MLLEDLLLAGFVLVIGALIGRPLFKLYRQLNPPKVDPVAVAKEHLAHVEAEAEAARLNKKAEHIIDELYQEELEEAHPDQKREHVK